jgi:ribose transport system permease protein
MRTTATKTAAHQTGASERAASGISRGWTVQRFLLDNSILIALIVAVVIFSVLSPTIFFSLPNLITVLRLASLGGIIVACYTCAMIAGQLDLSTPFVGGLTAVVFAVLFQVMALPLAIAFIIAIALAAGIGWFNSWLVNRVGIPTLIGTVAVGALCYGAAFLIVDSFGQSGVIRLTRPPLRSIVNTTLFNVPISVYLMFVVYFVVFVLLTHTRVGAHLYALGGNPQAARLNGIRTQRLIALVLMMTAVSAGVASILLSGRQMASGPAISILGASASGSLAAPASPLVAALFAGVSLSGGVGRVERTLFGVLFLAVLAIGMAIINLPAFVRILIEGLAFVAAILLDSIRQRMDTR